MSLYFSLKSIEKYNGRFEGQAVWKTHCLEDTRRVRLQQETPVHAHRETCAGTHVSTSALLAGEKRNGDWQQDREASRGLFYSGTPCSVVSEA